MLEPFLQLNWLKAFANYTTCHSKVVCDVEKNVFPFPTVAPSPVIVERTNAFWVSVFHVALYCAWPKEPYRPELFLGDCQSTTMHFSQFNSGYFDCSVSN